MVAAHRYIAENGLAASSEGAATETLVAGSAIDNYVSSPAEVPIMRSKVAEDRRSVQMATVKKHQSFIPRTWAWMAVVLGASYALAMIVSFTLMPLPVLLCAIGAVALASAGHRLGVWERQLPRSKALVAAAIILTIVAPLALTGTGFAIWLFSGAFDWRWGVSGLISINAFSSTFLSRRVPLLFVSIMAVWTPIALFDGSFEAIIALGMSSVVMLVVARHQTTLDKEFERRQEVLDRRRNRYRDLLNEYEQAGLGWFWETDRRGHLTYVSSRIARLLCSTPEKLVGTAFLSLFALGNDGDESERTLTFHISARSSFQELPVRAAIETEERWWSVSGRPMYDSFQNFVGFRGSGSDLTEKRRSQEQASRLAHFDSLTGLANRMQMGQTLEKILQSPRVSQRECTVMLLDLDRFKQVNDTLGHPVGDKLLKQVAQRLERCVGKSGQVGRLGGDEFQIVLAGRQTNVTLSNMANDIIKGLSQPYSINGQRIVIGASIGIARSPSNGLTTEAIIRNADLALYAAKDGGRGRYHFYSENLHTAAEERGQLESDLRDAITNGSLKLFYQPVIQAANEQISGFEALLRWHHPVHGWLSPVKFVPVAEDSGLIEAIGEWALRTACHDLAKWPESVRCAVNVSPLQFANPQLPAIVTSALAQAQVHPSRLELEITESVFLNEGEGTDAMFAALKGVGVRLALDDFGTGYSSLGYLKKAPFDKIKIDQSFVRGATQTGSRNGAIIASICSLAQALGMDTTAEGVETLDELDLVRSHGCSHIQGHIYHKALSADDATARLAAGLNAVANGPRSAREHRRTMFRKIILSHGGKPYTGTIRNISTTGALVTGIWEVPAGTEFELMLTDTQKVVATSRWSTDDRVGVEFKNALKQDASGKILDDSDSTESAPAPLRKAG